MATLNKGDEEEGDLGERKEGSMVLLELYL